MPATPQAPPRSFSTRPSHTSVAPLSHLLLRVDAIAAGASCGPTSHPRGSIQIPLSIPAAPDDGEPQPAQRGGGAPSKSVADENRLHTRCLRSPRRKAARGGGLARACGAPALTWWQTPLPL